MSQGVLGDPKGGREDGVKGGRPAWSVRRERKLITFLSAPPYLAVPCEVLDPLVPGPALGDN